MESHFGPRFKLMGRRNNPPLWVSQGSRFGGKGRKLKRTGRLTGHNRGKLSETDDTILSNSRTEFWVLTTCQALEMASCPLPLSENGYLRLARVVAHWAHGLMATEPLISVVQS